jgi:hypothetical protein
MKGGSRVRWRKSSYSNGEGSLCVEVTRTDNRLIAARDSKQPTGPILKYQRQEWRRFIEHVKAGKHDV